jgi:outer membrane protein OmpA-like peptidoglycan-associated protein
MALIWYFQGMVARFPCIIAVLLLGAALAAPAQQRKADTLVIHFAFDRSEVRAVDSAKMVEFGQKLAAEHADTVFITGHTDTVGAREYNQHLSWRRAIAAGKVVSSIFEAKGYLPAMDFVGRGKEEPLPGDDSLSRRAVIVVYYREKERPAVAHIDTPAAPAKSPGDPDTTIALENINFIANTSILTDAARQALPQTVPLLRQMSDKYLEIDGYCNQPGPLLPATDPLFILSVQRAKYIYNYLVSAGFDSTHLSYKGMGNASPKNAHPVTKADMDANMRVEIRVFPTPPK